MEERISDSVKELDSQKLGMRGEQVRNTKDLQRPTNICVKGKK